MATEQKKFRELDIASIENFADFWIVVDDTEERTSRIQFFDLLNLLLAEGDVDPGNADLLHPLKRIFINREKKTVFYNDGEDQNWLELITKEEEPEPEIPLEPSEPVIPDHERYALWTDFSDAPTLAEFMAGGISSENNIIEIPFPPGIGSKHLHFAIMSEILSEIKQQGSSFDSSGFFDEDTMTPGIQNNGDIGQGYFAYSSKRTIRRQANVQIWVLTP